MDLKRRLDKLEQMQRQQQPDSLVILHDATKKPNLLANWPSTVTFIPYNDPAELKRYNPVCTLRPDLLEALLPTKVQS